ncbi:MAG: zinc-dependent peptidase [Winogradskyella sp.]|uniref:zinc-dependent peptidase n=1 Tax=Winogradskyella sp. TaxID=1883156 RepID=UPI00385A7645
MLFLFQAEPASPPNFEYVFITLILGGMVWFILRRVSIYFEKLYALIHKKPIFLNTIIYSDSLTKTQLRIIETDFLFYSKLSHKDKKTFRHRVSRFISDKVFIGREGIEPTVEMKTMIASTAIMLTFGFRKYLIDIVETVIIYPKSYYSQINNAFHKGETNPQLKAIVFSWEDFKKGYKIGDDNLNLGIHEFGHAIHLNAAKNSDVSSLIFNQGFKKLTDYLQNHKVIRENLIASKYFRAYAFTNHYEVFAVLLENFIETPLEFKSQFPELYKYMQQMLNFKFTGY